MYCQNSRSGELTFRSGSSSGLVYLQNGRVIHAAVGALEGEDAIYQMLGWPPGSFALNEELLPQETTVTASWEQLLLEGARRADEGVSNSARAQMRSGVTSSPVISSRVRGSLPKIIVTPPDERAHVYELEAEYTHLGRAPGNEIPLSDPSISNRHCIFILQGSDVILRDLNSSNGTVVNGATISEVILQPGDEIRVGVVPIKFETAIRRPKLTQPLAKEFGRNSELSKAEAPEPSRMTLKLPQARTTVKPAPEPVPIRDDSAFVKGESAISYQNLPKPEQVAPGRRGLFVIIAAVVLLALMGGCYYYFVLRHH